MGAGLQLLAHRRRHHIAKALAARVGAAWAGQLEQAPRDVIDANSPPGPAAQRGRGLANAVPHMQAFGHVVLAWMWLDVADVADSVLAKDACFHSRKSAGRMGAARYFFHYELPKTGVWLAVVCTRDATLRGHYGRRRLTSFARAAGQCRHVHRAHPADRLPLR